MPRINPVPRSDDPPLGHDGKPLIPKTGLNAGLRAYQQWRRDVAAEAAPHVAAADAAWKAGADARAKACARATAAKRRAARRNQVPPWADAYAIRHIYAEAARLTKDTGVIHHVDHVIPLRGSLVSGLHVETNLRAIPWIDNLRKGNKLED